MWSSAVYRLHSASALSYHLQSGQFYPCEPSPASLIYQQNLQEITDAMKEKAVCLTLAKCAASLFNVLEDVYIEPECAKNSLEVSRMVFL